jgi:hypothetical protein
MLDEMNAHDIGNRPPGNLIHHKAQASAIWGTRPTPTVCHCPASAMARPQHRGLRGLFLRFVTNQVQQSSQQSSSSEPLLLVQHIVYC